MNQKLLLMASVIFVALLYQHQALAFDTYGEAIILAGQGDDPTDPIYQGIQDVADYFYRILITRGFSHETVYYMNANAVHQIGTDNFPVVDDSQPTVQKVKDAIAWAGNRQSTGPLYLFLIDHGMKQKLVISIKNGIYITAETLDQALDEFQVKTKRPVVVIIEACYSGSFVPVLTNGGESNRAVITSAGASETAAFADAWCFTRCYALRLFRGIGLAAAFVDTINSSAKNDYFQWQTPQAALASLGLQKVGIPFSVVPLAENDITPITNLKFFDAVGVQDGITLSRTVQSATLSATVFAKKGVKRVWALVLPPDYIPPTIGQEFKVMDLGEVEHELSYDIASDSYQAEFMPLEPPTKKTTYTVTYYMEDQDGEVVSTAFSQVEGGLSTISGISESTEQSKQQKKPTKLSKKIEHELLNKTGDEEIDFVITLSDTEVEDYPVEEEMITLAQTDQEFFQLTRNGQNITEKELNANTDKRAQKRYIVKQKHDERKKKISEHFLSHFDQQTKIKLIAKGLKIYGKLHRSDLDNFVSYYGDEIQQVSKPISTSKVIPHSATAIQTTNVQTFAHNYGFKGAGAGVFDLWESPTTSYFAKAGYQEYTATLFNPNIPNIYNESGYSSWLTIDTIRHPDKVFEVVHNFSPESTYYATGNTWPVFYSADIAQIIQDGIVKNNNIPFSPPVSVVNFTFGLTPDGDPGTSGNYALASQDNYWANDFDQQVYQFRYTIVSAMGNSAQYPNHVEPQAAAFNDITVGAFNDRQSPYSMASFSSITVPTSPSGDRIAPDVVAPGVDLVLPISNQLLYNNGVTKNSGTSYSSAIVAGMAADLISSTSFYKDRPEAVKAVIMAGAINNIVGDARLSNKDGAGGVDYLNTQFYRNVVYYEGANNSYFDSQNKTYANYTLEAGKRYRAVLVWSEPSWWPLGHNGQPQMDLDLTVSQPNGSAYKYSSSFDNTFEIIDFIAPTTGSYKFTISRYRNSYSNANCTPNTIDCVAPSQIKMALSVGRADL